MLGRRAATLTAGMMFVLAGCAATPGANPTPATTSLPATPSPSPTPTPVEGRLGEALAYVPPVTSSIAFTDWATTKASVGAERLTGASSFEEKAAALRSEATPAGFGLRFLPAHAGDWGFDVMDLDWDLVVQGVGAPPFWVLRFRGAFDLAAIQSRFDEREFAREEVGGAVLRSHDLDLARSWVASTELAILHAGFLPDGRTVILSSSAAAVRELLVNGPASGTDPSVRSVARLLGTPLAASILIGSDTCVGLEEGILREPVDLRAQIDASLAAVGPLAAYNALAVGYDRALDPIGRIVIGYPEQGLAESDLAGRQTLAQTGISSRTRVPYVESVFELAGVRVEERAIVLELAPLGARPVGLFAMVQDRDMLFAACSA